ncbi:MAG: hypothetical protein JSV62_14085 [Promethearchaeota archaeon]|nr:MAG: hypothetical protein JSV62_14085 [Candidatus Lokiarchaeota archaeon]
MNYKKISLFVLLSFFLIPITYSTAFTYIDNIKNGNYVFFLIDLQENETLELSLTHEASGNFTLFLFSNRPQQSYINSDNSLNEIIFNRTVAYSLLDNPYISYIATIETIYYIEIILVSGGPDTFTFTANKDLTRYYLPIIPGFSLEYIAISIFIITGIVIILYKKKISK